MTIAQPFNFEQPYDDANDTHAFVDTQVLRSSVSGYNYNVCLVSRELELDYWDVPVPKDWKTVPVVVAKDTPQAAMDFASNLPYFAAYEAVDAWKPLQIKLEECPF